MHMKALLLLKVEELDGAENPRNCGPEKGTATPKKQRGEKQEHSMEGPLFDSRTPASNPQVSALSKTKQRQLMFRRVL